MTMPIDLVLVRHGESEGNAARRFSVGGDNSVFTEELCGRHTAPTTSAPLYIWIRPILSRKTCSIGTPKYLVGNVTGATFANSYVDRTVIFWVGGPVGMGMVHNVMHAFFEQVVGGTIS